MGNKLLQFLRADLESDLARLLPFLPFQTATDAEKRSKPVLIPYRRGVGARVRRLIGSRGRRYAVIVFLVFLIFVVGTVVGSILAMVSFVVGSFVGDLAMQVSKLTVDSVMLFLWSAPPLLCSALLFFAALISPNDELYMDRLTFVTPDRNPLIVAPKILWSKVEELQIVDLAKNSSKSRFALRLLEPTGETHDIYLNALERESLPTLVSYIRTYASHVRGLAQLQELERFYDYQQHKLEGISYTQLWESCSTTQFGLTSFTPLEPGTLLQERFKVVKQIAAGGFSAVYLIGDEEEQRFILKESVVPTNLDEELRRKAVEQFQREAKLLARLEHPQIAAVYDHFVENNRSYLRMECIDGPNLRKYVSESKAQLEGTVQSWIEQLAAILEYLHDLSPPVVHRDLSPDNVVVRNDGRLVLIDFGAANEFIGQATGTLVGKHAYMAPEQIRGNAEPRSDIYSLGSCAYFCLTGRDPEPIRCSSPRSVAPHVSEWFDSFVRRATALDQEERLQSATECLQYLRRPHELALEQEGGTVAGGWKNVASEENGTGAREHVMRKQENVVNEQESSGGGRASTSGSSKNSAGG